jgi:hypothetical protein
MRRLHHVAASGVAARKIVPSKKTKVTKDFPKWKCGLSGFGEAWVFERRPMG